MNFSITLYAPDEAAANRGANAAFAKIEAMNAIFSDYDEASEASQLVRQPIERPVPVSADLWNVLVRAENLHRDSHGAFDVTVGPVVKLWRRSRRQKELPDSARLQEALTQVGQHNLKLDEKTHSVTLARSDLRLDFGGIAVGYAIDGALEVLREHGIRQALIDGSGDIGVGDAPPGKEGWTIGIVPLGGPESLPSRYILLENAAVTTSGDAFQHVEIAGVRYSHIVDPKTGLGLTTRLSATVIAPDCTSADCLATALCVLGPTEGLKLIESHASAAALFVQATDGEPQIVESPRFAEFAVAAPAVQAGSRLRSNQ